MKRVQYAMIILVICLTGIVAAQSPETTKHPRTLEQIKQAGVIRHIGVPYANFISGSGDGLDVELMKRFAKRIGVKYQYVDAKWSEIFPKLLGREVNLENGKVQLGRRVPVEGDVIANGLTIIPWRLELVDYSIPTFPTQVWLMAHADCDIKPIAPSGNLMKDIRVTKAKLKGRGVLTKPGTCLDPALYGFEDLDIERVISFQGGVNELAPALLNGDAETTILDVPDALIALQKWPGKVKVIGPISRPQKMGFGFPKSSPELRSEFNEFFKEIWNDGTYRKLAGEYYPAVFRYYDGFFEKAPWKKEKADAEEKRRVSVGPDER